MNLRLLLFLLLWLPAYGSAMADSGTRRHPQPRPVVPTSQTLTGQLLLGAHCGYVAVGTGMEYERYITTPQDVSATLKAAAYYGGTIRFSEIDDGEIRSQIKGAYLAPGLRYHPFRNRTHAELGIGLSLPLGVGFRRDGAGGTQGPNHARTSGFYGACMAELSLNLRGGTPHQGVFGFFATAGIVYSDAIPQTFRFRSQYIEPQAAPHDPICIMAGIRFGAGW